MNKRHVRPILKSLSYRMLSMIVTFLLAWIITNDITVGMTLGAADFFIKLFLYYFHELLWNRRKKG